MKSILTGLSSTAVYRLKKSWGLLEEKQLAVYNDLQELVSNDKNFAKFRAEMKLANSPSIPFLGCSLTDLIYTSDGNKNSDGNMINFYKVRSIGNTLNELQTRQKSNYPFGRM